MRPTMYNTLLTAMRVACQWPHLAGNQAAQTLPGGEGFFCLHGILSMAIRACPCLSADTQGSADGGAQEESPWPGAHPIGGADMALCQPRS
jgi:hypothetical protein